MFFTFYMPFCIHYFIPTSALYAASTQSRDETQKQWCQRHVWQWHCHVQLYMYRVYSRRLWKQLSGEPVLTVGKRWGLSLTDWGWLERKYLIQEQVAVSIWRWSSLVVLQMAPDGSAPSEGWWWWHPPWTILLFKQTSKLFARKLHKYRWEGYT